MLIFCRISGLKTGPDGSGQPSGFIWTKFQDKPSILNPFWTKFVVFGPNEIFGLKSGPDGSGQPSGFIWTKFQAKLSSLDLIRTIFDDLGPNRHCGPDLDLQDAFGPSLFQAKP